MFRVHEAPCPRYSQCHSHRILRDDTEICEIDNRPVTKGEKTQGRRGNAGDVVGCLFGVILLIAVGLAALKFLLDGIN